MKPETLFRFFNRLRACGALVSIIFAFTVLYWGAPRGGLRPIYDHRISFEAWFDLQCFLLQACSLFCYAGALFAIIGLVGRIFACKRYGGLAVS
ncbi:MAG TPA: hypothetical protein VL981_00420 [Candidatus Methylacidiphilales bacterium]|nr:hypothetical protein [Candidatus Methylacidiphilales bacterium]